MSKSEFIIEFSNVSSAEAGVLARSLKEALENASAEIAVDTIRPDPKTMDFGSTLIVVLGTPAVTLAVQAIRDYIKKHRNATIDIKDKDKRVLISNLSSKDATRLTEFILK